MLLKPVVSSLPYPVDNYTTFQHFLTSRKIKPKKMLKLLKTDVFFNKFSTIYKIIKKFKKTRIFGKKLLKTG